MKTLKSKVLFQNKYGYKFYEDRVDFGSAIGNYNYLEHTNGFVAIAAYEKGYTYLIKNYRYPIKKYIWELPKGYINTNESPLSAAKRELKEETGIVAKKWKKIGIFYVSPGIADIPCHLYVAANLNHTKDTFEEGNERIVEISKFKVGNNEEIRDTVTRLALMLCAKIH